MKCLPLLLLLCLFQTTVSAHGHVLPDGFVMEENFITGLAEPTDIDFAPDGRIFICEKAGTIRVVENGVMLPQPIYSVATQVTNERGLQGMALDPDFDNNGYIYVFHTLPFENRNVVKRLTMAGNGVVPGSEIELFRVMPMWGAWHNGGAMVFDASGKLIIGTGDGTAYTSSQNLQSTMGKILRINTDGTIPTDNPWYNTFTGEFRAIAATGIRNPYTMAISRLTGRIFFNDVGNVDYEEVNEYIPGKNYGWHHVEGWLNGNPAPDTNYMDPLHVYDHQYGCAIVGATFYEPLINQFPAEYFGKYFFLEYCEGKILAMDPDDFNVSEFGTGLDAQYNNIETGPDGKLYLINFAKGNMARISYQGQNSAPVISIHPEDRILAVGEGAQLTVIANGSNLTYEWYKNGNLQAGQTQSFLALSNVQLAEDGDEYYVRVTNPYGNVTSNTMTLSVVNGTRPTVQFLNMPMTYVAGDTIPYAATATDSDQPNFTPADFSWKIDFFHDDHSHPILGSTSGMTSGEYYFGTFGEVDTNVFVRFELTVTDNSGLYTIATYDVHPELIDIQVTSNPPGVPINVDGIEGTTDFDLYSVRNLRRTVEVPHYAIVRDSLYEFVDWGDGVDSLVRIFSAQEDTFVLNFNGIQEYFHATPTQGTRTVFSDTGSAQQFYREQYVPHIKENWDILSPYPWDNPPFLADTFSVRWQGTIVPPVSDYYTFYLFHDGKVTLQVGDSILLQDRKSVGALQEDTVGVWLNSGDSYLLTLDYDHYNYIARVELDWQYSLVERQTVPFMSNVPLDSPEVILDVNEGIKVFPNPIREDRFRVGIPWDLHTGSVPEIKVFDMMGRMLTDVTTAQRQEFYEVATERWPAGIYFVTVTMDSETYTIKCLKN